MPDTKLGLSPRVRGNRVTLPAFPVCSYEVYPRVCGGTGDVGR